MNPAGTDEIDGLRRRLARLRADARQWLLRGVLLLVIAAFSFRRGGSLFVTMGAALVLLALIAVSMSRIARNRREAAQRKLELLDAAGKAGGPAT